MCSERCDKCDLLIWDENFESYFCSKSLGGEILYIDLNTDDLSCKLTNKDEQND